MPRRTLAARKVDGRLGSGRVGARASAVLIWAQLERTYAISRPATHLRELGPGLCWHTPIMTSLPRFRVESSMAEP